MSKGLQKLIDSYIDWFVTQNKPLNGIKKAYIRQLCRRNDYGEAIKFVKSEWLKCKINAPRHSIAFDASCLKDVINK